ncbi:hypothetical protein C445_20182 [Halobiforma lacisalsi AJ5]|uniref:Uncharacterized protein n=1 Tax=Natronobacterium lacisalsi AJ5 TaxID=358396 RepID=M0L6G0_NATLA|nr:hypothetical protein C445_20182 [Halobiforma lacisalsi AJ5]
MLLIESLEELLYRRRTGRSDCIREIDVRNFGEPIERSHEVLRIRSKGIEQTEVDVDTTLECQIDRLAKGFEHLRPRRVNDILELPVGERSEHLDDIDVRVECCFDIAGNRASKSDQIGLEVVAKAARRLTIDRPGRREASLNIRQVEATKFYPRRNLLFYVVRSSR